MFGVVVHMGRVCCLHSGLYTRHMWAHWHIRAHNMGGYGVDVDLTTNMHPNGSHHHTPLTLISANALGDVPACAVSTYSATVVGGVVVVVVVLVVMV